jgi:hypothetical protein
MPTETARIPAADHPGRGKRHRKQTEEPPCRHVRLIVGRQVEEACPPRKRSPEQDGERHQGQTLELEKPFGDVLKTVRIHKNLLRAGDNATEMFLSQQNTFVIRKLVPAGVRFAFAYRNPTPRTNESSLHMRVRHPECRARYVQPQQRRVQGRGRACNRRRARATRRRVTRKLRGSRGTTACRLQ